MTEVEVHRRHNGRAVSLNVPLTLSKNRRFSSGDGVKTDVTDIIHESFLSIVEKSLFVLSQLSAQKPFEVYFDKSDYQLKTFSKKFDGRLRGEPIAIEMKGLFSTRTVWLANTPQKNCFYNDESYVLPLAMTEGGQHATAHGRDFTYVKKSEAGEFWSSKNDKAVYQKLLDERDTFYGSTVHFPLSSREGTVKRMVCYLNEVSHLAPLLIEPPPSLDRSEISVWYGIDIRQFPSTRKDPLLDAYSLLFYLRNSLGNFLENPRAAIHYYSKIKGLELQWNFSDVRFDGSGRVKMLLKSDRETTHNKSLLIHLNQGEGGTFKNLEFEWVSSRINVR